MVKVRSIEVEKLSKKRQVFSLVIFLIQQQIYRK